MRKDRRRGFLLASSALLAAPLVLRAQPGAKVPAIGLLDAGMRLSWWKSFRLQMSELGYQEGKTIRYEPRYARDQLARLPALANELARMQVAVIVTAATAATQAAKRATDRIPIVTATGADHVSMGFAASLARPGGNVTGLTTLGSDLTLKRLELLREVFPKLSRLAVLWQSDNPGSTTAFRDLEHATQEAKIVLRNVGVRTSDELPGAFAAAAKERAEAMFVIGGPLTIDEHAQIGALASKHRLPTMSTSSLAFEDSLISLAVHTEDLFRRAAIFVDKILKGAKPGDLPIEQPTKFELAVNLKVARFLGVAIPQSVLIRADRAIE